MNYSDFRDYAHERLPQASLIKPDDMRRWYDAIMQQEPERLLWHVNRLANVGGSEIGVIVADVLGLPPPFEKRPSHVYASKLMLSPIESPDEAMLFGTKHENAVCTSFEALAFSYGWRRADDILALFEARSASPMTRSGLGYSPDDVFYNDSNRVVVVDYKTPYRDLPAEGGGVGVGYVSQLHQGGEVLKELGFEQPDMLLVYGVHPESFLKERSKSLYLRAFDVEFNPAIAKIINEQGRNFFNDHVLTLRDPDEALLEKISGVQSDAYTLRKLREEFDQTQEKINALSQKMSSELLAMSDDMPRAIEKLKEVGVPMTPAVTRKITASADAIEQAWHDAGRSKDDSPVRESLGGLDAPKILEALKKLDPTVKDDDYKTPVKSINRDAFFAVDTWPKNFVDLSISWRINANTKPEPKAEDAATNLERLIRRKIAEIDEQIAQSTPHHSPSPSA